MPEDEVAPIQPAPAWVAPTLGSLFTLGLAWLLYPRSAWVRSGIDLVTLQDERAPAWLYALLAAGLALPWLLGAAGRLRPQWTDRTDRRGFALLAFSEALPAWNLIILAALVLAAQAATDAWIEARHGLNFTSDLHAWEGSGAPGLQHALRGGALRAVLDPLSVAAATYGWIAVALALPAWWAWKRNDALLAPLARSWAWIALACAPFYWLLPVDPPWVALGALEPPAGSTNVLGHAWNWPRAPTAFPLASNNLVPSLSAAELAALLAILLRSRARLAAAAMAAPAALMVVAPVYLGQTWLLAVIVGAIVGAAIGFAAAGPRSEPRSAAA